MDKYVAILGSDSEEEMSTKPDYIDALKMVHQLDGTIILSQPDLPRYAPNYNQLNATNHGGFIKLKKVSVATTKTTQNMSAFEFNDTDDSTRINTSITKSN